MKALTVLLTVIGVVVADVGLGYQYKVPHTSYGVPYNQYASGSNTVNRVSGAGLSGQGSYANYNGQSNNLGSYQIPNRYQTSGSAGLGQTGTSEYQNSGSYQSVVPLQSSGASINSYYQQQQQQKPINYEYQQNYQTASQYQQQYQQYYNQVQQQPAQVFKHFYVHAAPEEPEVPKFRQPLVLPAPQKHYKIIFIKTPSQAAPAPQYVPLQQQNEEKTIVYVLVKKPEEAGDIVLPKVEQKKPTKPEVFFIKYNSKEGSQGVINNIVSNYNNGQSGAVYSGNGGAIDTPVQQGSGTVDSISEIFGTNGGQSQGFSSQGGQGFSSQGGQGFSSQGSQGFSSHGSQGAVNSGDAGLLALGLNESSGNQVVSTSQAGAYDANASGSSVASSNALAQSGFTGGDVGSFNGIGTSQGLPHETYGPPKFSLQ